MNLHWTTAGPPDLPPLVLLHGFMGRGDDWADLAHALSLRRHCLMPDLPGHGDSLAGQAYDVAATAAALVADLDEMSVVRTDLLGYSLGGRMALYTALAYPQRVERLVLESATAGLEDTTERRERRETDARRVAALREGGVSEFVEAWYRQPLFASLDLHAGLREDLVRRRSRNDAEGLARSLEGIGAGVFPSLWRRLPELGAPALFLGGALDGKYRALARRLADGLPDARHVEIARAGHIAHLERPRRFADVVVAFLA
jgi:2-succinyl-6-hydroxy-2,4-cyclohexadiene-1-carboxylate synthase